MKLKIQLFFSGIFLIVSIFSILYVLYIIIIIPVNLTSYSIVNDYAKPIYITPYSKTNGDSLIRPSQFYLVKNPAVEPIQNYNIKINPSEELSIWFDDEQEVLKFILIVDAYDEYRILRIDNLYVIPAKRIIINKQSNIQPKHSITLDENAINITRLMKNEERMIGELIFYFIISLGFINLFYFKGLLSSRKQNKAFNNKQNAQT